MRVKLKTKTVEEVNSYIAKQIKSDVILQNLAVKGEISNLSARAGGHVFFNLIDGASQISCVMFSSVAMRQKIQISNNSSVLVLGSLGVYEKLGKYQIYVNAIHVDEESYRHEIYLRLKAKLEKLGYFDKGRKRLLPKNIKRIGLVCSKTSAAIVDFLSVLAKKAPLIEIVLIDVHVQGDMCAKEVCLAIEKLQESEDIDLIVVTRGGGSQEELFVFNDESICKAAFMSKIPILSAIGHERDSSLLDFSADISAGTPSIAAQMISEDFFESSKMLDSKLKTLKMSSNTRLEYDELVLNSKMNSLKTSSASSIELSKSSIENKLYKVRDLISSRLKRESEVLNSQRKMLDSYDVSNVLARGFAIVSKDNLSLTRASDLKVGSTINIRFYDSNINAKVLNTNE